MCSELATLMLQEARLLKSNSLDMEDAPLCPGRLNFILS